MSVAFKLKLECQQPGISFCRNRTPFFWYSLSTHFMSLSSSVFPLWPNAFVLRVCRQFELIPESYAFSTHYLAYTVWIIALRNIFGTVLRTFFFPKTRTYKEQIILIILSCFNGKLPLIPFINSKFSAL